MLIIRVGWQLTDNQPIQPTHNFKNYEPQICF